MKCFLLMIVVRKVDEMTCAMFLEAVVIPAGDAKRGDGGENWS